MATTTHRSGDDVFSVFANSIVDMFTATITWPLRFITFDVKMIILNGQFVNKLPLLPSNSHYAQPPSLTPYEPSHRINFGIRY
jgi:hypothetical protein